MSDRLPRPGAGAGKASGREGEGWRAAPGGGEPPPAAGAVPAARVDGGLRVDRGGGGGGARGESQLTGSPAPARAAG